MSLWIRLQLEESPVFKQMKEEGTTSKAPLTEAFGRWENLKWVIVALFGAVAGQAVVWYSGQFYALFFLEKTLKVDGATANILIAIALALGTPFFILFGWLSDKIGRKPIILAGCALAAITYFPAFQMLTEAANPAMAKAQASAAVKVNADPGACAFQFDPVGKEKFESTGCDIAKSALAKAGVSYTSVTRPRRTGEAADVWIGNRVLVAPEPWRLAEEDRAAAAEAFRKELSAATAAAGYPAKADLDAMNKPLVVAILFYLVLLVTMVYGPIAALLVELFPSRIRYTAMSLPYHIGNGWFGGFLPTTAFAMVAATGNIYFGLWYPIAVAAFTAIVGLLFLKEMKGNPIEA